MSICRQLGWTASIFAIGIVASAAQAQNDEDVPINSGEPAASPQEDTSYTESQDIIVTGIRASQRASIDAKRNLGVIADVLTAEDIGKFPDKNVAEALQRVPGVVINREFGEGERVSLRGTAPNLTKTLVNGHGIATADWFVLEQLAATRSFNYLTLPSEIVGQLEVYKSPQADVEEGGIGATINVNTRDPLDLDAWTISASAQAVYSEKRDSFDPQASGLVSWKNSSETFGILIGGVYQKRKIRRDGVEVLGYFDYDVNGETVKVPSLIGSALFEQERERYGGNIGIQFRPSDEFELNVTGLYSKFNANNFNQNFLAWGSNALGGGGTLSSPTVRDGTVVSGRIDSIPGGRAAVYDAIDRTAFAETYSGDVDALIHPRDGTTIHLKAGYTEAHGDTVSQPFYEGGAPGGFTFDLTGRTPQVGFIGLDPTDPGDLAFDFGSLHQITNTDQEFYVYGDFEQELDLGPVTAIKVGGKYVDHNRDAAFLATTYGGFFLPLLANGCGGPCTSADFAGDLTPDDFLSNIASPGTLTNFFQVDRERLRSIYNGLPAAVRARIINPPENYSIRELSYGAYAMAKFEGTGYRGNLGVRVVRTEQRSQGNQIGIPPGPGTVNDNAFGVYLPITVDRSYTDWLPSFNIAIDITPDLIVRFGAARAIARPDYTDIVPRISLNPGSLTAAGGNPFVDPYRSNQADLSVEFYPDNETIFAAALYYKDIESYITDRIFQQNFPVQTATPNTSRCTLLNAADNLYDCTFDVNQRDNGPGGKNKGIELQASRRLFAGFGAILNYTYSDATIDGGGQVPGNSEHSFNATGYYEANGLSARLSYTYRSDFFITIDRAAPLNQTATDSLDGSLSYQLTPNIALTADAINLTNHKIVQFSGTPDRPRAIYDNGRQFYAGVRVRF
ncbi:TonB-dependent receptor [Novosphingopyxis sp.]|uniref:TonB-dependent receptor n=1 Tax=Novosphingopyxis sp. TaxID=2709690 RepID=UPI003B5BDCC9